MDMLNESLTDIGCSSLKVYSKKPNARTKYGKRKFEQLSVQARKKIATEIEFQKRLCFHLNSSLRPTSVNAEKMGK